jgi:trehalose 6-phosphate synthase/phosphatase
MKKRLVIVSNRLPVTIEKKKKEIRYKKSVGGLAVGMASVYGEYDSLWLGWSGVPRENLSQQQVDEITRELQDQHGSYPIFLTKSDVNAFYYGFCNKTIWPLFHYFSNYTTYERNLWSAYKRVNRIFADTALQFLQPGDTLWIHDYHLLLLPEMIRQRNPDVKIGFFLHIPFPSFEIFRLIPWRRELLEGMLGAHLLGFHTYDYVRHFHSSVRRLLGYEHELGRIIMPDHVCRVDAFPMGIDYSRYAEAGNLPDVQQEMEKVTRKISDQKIVLSVDRLDYSKGILHRLQAFDYFLQTYPEYHEKVVLILIAVPSRTSVETYQQLKKELDEIIGRINGKYGSIGWIPVWYLYRFLPFDELSAIYCISDVALVTPLRDGMNLIAKEYVACKADRPGVLILSGMAGSASELGEAIIVNPNNTEQMAHALKEGLEMPVPEQKERLSAMQRRLRRYNVVRWAGDFMEKLEESWKYSAKLHERRITSKIRDRIIDDYSRSSRRLLLLAYDGTLVQFTRKPNRAEPDQEILTNLKELSRDRRNEVVIISGRDKSSLTKWFSGLDVSLVAEHGVWIRKKGDEWKLIEPIRQDWKPEVFPILEMYMDRTPGSTLEEKEFSLVWHYRRSDPDLAEQRVNELKENLLNLTENLNVGILEGNKVVEIRNLGINKGTAALRWLQNGEWDFIMAVGNDVTDEDMYQVLPEETYSIKVGLGHTKANYNIAGIDDVRTLIAELARGKT